MRKSWIILSIGLSLILLECSEGGAYKPQPLNPNGDSELAILMREMYDDGMRTKQQLLEGKQPEVHVKYKLIHSAKATEPEKVATPTFTSFAALYEISVDSLLESNAGNRTETYTSMINACMNCHGKVCPGPKDRIKHLYLSEKEKASLAQNQGQE